MHKIAYKMILNKNSTYHCKFNSSFIDLFYFITQSVTTLIKIKCYCFSLIYSLRIPCTIGMKLIRYVGLLSVFTCQYLVAALSISGHRFGKNKEWILLTKFINRIDNTLHYKSQVELSIQMSYSNCVLYQKAAATRTHDATTTQLWIQDLPGGGGSSGPPEKCVIWASEYNLGPQIWGPGGPGPPGAPWIRYCYNTATTAAAAAAADAGRVML